MSIKFGPGIFLDIPFHVWRTQQEVGEEHFQNIQARGGAWVEDAGGAGSPVLLFTAHRHWSRVLSLKMSWILFPFQVDIFVHVFFMYSSSFFYPEIFIFFQFSLHRKKYFPGLFSHGLTRTFYKGTGRKTSWKCQEQLIWTFAFPPTAMWAKFQENVRPSLLI